MRPVYFVIRGQDMMRFGSRGHDMLQFQSDADHRGAEYKALVVANLCYKWPDYVQTDIAKDTIIWPNGQLMVIFVCVPT